MFFKLFVKLILPSAKCRRKVEGKLAYAKTCQYIFRFFAKFAIGYKGFLTPFILNYQLPKKRTVCLPFLTPLFPKPPTYLRSPYKHNFLIYSRCANDCEQYSK